MWASNSFFSLVLLTLLLGMMTFASDALRAQEPPNVCSFDEILPSSDGHRRIAMLIGVDRYRHRSFAPLQGAKNDVSAMSNLLAGAEDNPGYDFKNICKLTNENATLANVRRGFENIASTARVGDLILIYFAGYGGSWPDDNGDEPDGLDEVLLLHDSMVSLKGGEIIPPLFDDELNYWLDQIHQKLGTANIVLILDASTSASQTQTRSAKLGGRFVDLRSAFPKELKNRALFETQFHLPEGEGSQIAKADKHAAVVLTASDIEPAYETEMGGEFTVRLIKKLNTPGQDGNYESITPRLRLQDPQVSGLTSRNIFDLTRAQLPSTWVVSKVEGSDLHLNGPLVPGLGLNAEFRIYNANTSQADLTDRAKAAMSVKVRSSNGISAIATLKAGEIAEGRVSVGDIGIPQSSAPGFKKVEFDLTELDTELRTAIQRELKYYEYASTLASVQFEESTDASFTITQTSTGPGKPSRVIIKDATGSVRNQISMKSGLVSAAKQIAKRIFQHTFANALLRQASANNDVLLDNRSTTIQLTPRQLGESRLCLNEPTNWQANQTDGQVSVPVCAGIEIEVAASAELNKPIYVEALWLDSTGDCEDIFSRDLSPGAVTSDLFVALPPIDGNSTIFVFASEAGGSVRGICSAVSSRTSSDFQLGAASAAWSKTTMMFRVVDSSSTPFSDNSCKSEIAHLCKVLE